MLRGFDMIDILFQAVIIGLGATALLILIPPAIGTLILSWKTLSDFFKDLRLGKI